MTFERTLHTVLPSGSTKLERAMVYAFDQPPHARVIPTVWDVDNCPKNLLPWLAWALNIDVWSGDWPELYQRNVIKNAQQIQAVKGTIGAVKQALADLGHDNAQVLERVSGGRYYGQSDTYDGTIRYGDPTLWATYAVKLFRPVTIKQANLIRARLENVKRACVHLIYLDFSSAPMLYGTPNFYYDGQYTHGII